MAKNDKPTAGKRTTVAVIKAGTRTVTETDLQTELKESGRHQHKATAKVKADIAAK
jgi:hypothetical protein